MLGENVKNLRKSKGYSQEALAGQLHVVRQTISKWEKGISVPDAEMLSQIAELFEVPVSELLGSSIPEPEERQDIGEVARQLAVLNEQLASQAVRRRRIIKRAFLGIFLGIAMLLFVVMALSFAGYSQYQKGETSLRIEADHTK